MTEKDWLLTEEACGRRTLDAMQGVLMPFAVAIGDLDTEYTTQSDVQRGLDAASTRAFDTRDLELKKEEFE